MRKLSFQIAFGGIITALCVLLMFSVGILPMFVFVIPMISSLLIFILDYECGTKTAVVSYISTSLLALILSPDKESAVVFAVYFGCYPILNVYIEKLKSAVLRWILRLGFFNISIIAGYFVLIKLFTAVTLDDFGEWTAPILLAIGNLVAILYEFSLRNVSRLYVSKLRKTFFKRK